MLVTAIVATGGLGRTPFLIAPALTGGALAVWVLRGVRPAAGAGATHADGDDDWPSFTRLALAVVCRSVAFVGMSTFVAFRVRERTGWGVAAGTAALFVLYLGSAVGTGDRLAALPQPAGTGRPGR